MFLWFATSAFATSSADGTAFARNGPEPKCIHPLRDDFGSIAVIAPILRQSSEAGSYSAATARCFNHGGYEDHLGVKSRKVDRGRP
jgi:hypothetical protein